jgi:hypothetical protein
MLLHSPIISYYDEPANSFPAKGLHKYEDQTPKRSLLGSVVVDIFIGVASTFNNHNRVLTTLGVVECH